MDKFDYPREHPEKAQIEKEYEECVQRQLEKGKELEALQKQREDYLKYKVEQTAIEEQEWNDYEPPVRPKAYWINILVTCCINLCLCCCAKRLFNNNPLYPRII